MTCCRIPCSRPPGLSVRSPDPVAERQDAVQPHVLQVLKDPVHHRGEPDTIAVEAGGLFVSSPSGIARLTNLLLQHCLKGRTAVIFLSGMHCGALAEALKLVDTSNLLLKAIHSGPNATEDAYLQLLQEHEAHGFHR